MKKRLTMIAAALIAAVLAAVPVRAEGWKLDNTGWWWQDEDGSWPAGEWRWLDGNGDGTEECYYFGPDGYLLTGTVTPDEYTVNGDGAWTEQGVVCTRQVSPYGPAADGGASAQGAHAALPAYDAPVTEENIMALLDNLDPDGARILRDAAISPSAAYNPLMGWWNGAARITDALSTAVHEECHIAGFSDNSFIRRSYYVGGGYVVLDKTPVFDSKEMIGTIPQSLRTFRFDTYLGSTAPANMASRCEGPYGLLDEYNAYCWGTNNELKTFDYCMRSGKRAWSNSWLAQAEFRYYILRYMLYARDYHPDVYQGILNNYSFRQAFTMVDTRFEAVVRELHQKLPDYAIQFAKGEYDALMAEMEKPEYQEMRALLRP